MRVKFRSVVMRYIKSTVSLRLVVDGLMRAILSPQALCLLPRPIPSWRTWVSNYGVRQYYLSSPYHHHRD
jgi:hypothetical protein